MDKKKRSISIPVDDFEILLSSYEATKRLYGSKSTQKSTFNNQPTISNNNILITESAKFGQQPLHSCSKGPVEKSSATAQESGSLKEIHLESFSPDISKLREPHGNTSMDHSDSHDFRGVSCPDEVLRFLMDYYRTHEFSGRPLAPLSSLGAVSPLNSASSRPLDTPREAAHTEPANFGPSRPPNSSNDAPKMAPDSYPISSSIGYAQTDDRGDILDSLPEPRTLRARTPPTHVSPQIYSTPVWAPNPLSTPLNAQTGMVLPPVLVGTQTMNNASKDSLVKLAMHSPIPINKTTFFRKAVSKLEPLHPTEGQLRIQDWLEEFVVVAQNTGWDPMDWPQKIIQYLSPHVRACNRYDAEEILQLRAG